MKKVKLVFNIPFTGKTPKGINKDGFTSQEWYEKRADIFINYTLKSLKQQTNKNFILWITFRPQEIFNGTTKIIAQALTKSGIQNIMSFNGTMFTEDKAIWHNTDLKERLEKCLHTLKEFVGDADYVYETNLDSDDTVHKKFSEIVLNYRYKKRGALYCQKGFVYRTTGQVAEWFNPISQQNYTIMFPVKTYFDAEKRLKYLDGLKTHEEVPTKFEANKMPDGMYCSIIHGDNITTEWTHPFRGAEKYYEDEKREITKDFF
mgnify:CR=1 FL=1